MDAIIGFKIFKKWPVYMRVICGICLRISWTFFALTFGCGDLLISFQKMSSVEDLKLSTGPNPRPLTFYVNLKKYSGTQSCTMHSMSISDKRSQFHSILIVHEY